MTRKEALKILKRCCDRGFNRTTYTYDEYVTARDMAIEALEQEPYGDCINRTEVIKALEYDLSIEADGGLDKYRTVIKDLLNAIYNTQKKAIEDLPSIQPQLKTGHWIRQDNTKEPLYGWYFCSECNSVIGDKTKFCSNCGAKMVDPQESEE